MFYARLFELDPNVKLLFKSDLKERGRKLMAMIATAVAGLDRLDEIVPAVQALGARHVGYVSPTATTDTVAAALLWTLERGLGEAFTPEVKAAWTACYGLVAATMKGRAGAGRLGPHRGHKGGARGRAGPRRPTAAERFSLRARLV